MVYCLQGSIDHFVNSRLISMPLLLANCRKMVKKCIFLLKFGPSVLRSCAFLLVHCPLILWKCIYQCCSNSSLGFSAIKVEFLPVKVSKWNTIFCSHIYLSERWWSSNAPFVSHESSFSKRSFMIKSVNATLESLSHISLFLFLFCSIRCGLLTVPRVHVCAISGVGKRF